MASSRCRRVGDPDHPWPRPHLVPTEPAPPGSAGRGPVGRLTPMAGAMPVYSGSTQLACEGCGRPTWYGPRLRDKIDAGEVRAGCGDCLYAYGLLHQGAETEVPGVVERMVNLGNPEPKRVRTEWEIDVIRHGASWLARGRCTSINGSPVGEAGWRVVRGVAGDTEDVPAP